MAFLHLYPKMSVHPVAKITTLNTTAKLNMYFYIENETKTQIINGFQQTPEILETKSILLLCKMFCCDATKLVSIELVRSKVPCGSFIFQNKL